MRFGKRGLCSSNELAGNSVEEEACAAYAWLTYLSSRLLDAKQRDPKADTTALEPEIDRLVYQLYDLSPEEIAVVEDSTRAK